MCYCVQTVQTFCSHKNNRSVRHSPSTIRRNITVPFTEFNLSLFSLPELFMLKTVSTLEQMQKKWKINGKQRWKCNFVSILLNLFPLSSLTHNGIRIRIIVTSAINTPVIRLYHDSRQLYFSHINFRLHLVFNIFTLFSYSEAHRKRKTSKTICIQHLKIAWISFFWMSKLYSFPSFGPHCSGTKWHNSRWMKLIYLARVRICDEHSKKKVALKMDMKARSVPYFSEGFMMLFWRNHRWFCFSINQCEVKRRPWICSRFVLMSVEAAEKINNLIQHCIYFLC